MTEAPKHKSVIIVDMAISLIENPHLITTELLNSCDDEGKSVAFCMAKMGFEFTEEQAACLTDDDRSHLKIIESNKNVLSK
tara:strand:+ start:122 stop:364 length:243 start_codon:yes stop_codon:yes gene_type:complete